jgi:hypothetical protein
MLTPLLFVVLTAVQSQAVSPPRDASAPGRKTCAISGRVTEQQSGRPLPRAIVKLAGKSQRLEAIADAQGPLRAYRSRTGRLRVVGDSWRADRHTPAPGI